MFALCLHITIIIVIKCRTRKLILGLSAQFPRRSICCRLLEKTARKNSSASEPTLPFKIQSLSLPIYNSNKMMSCLHFTEVKLLPKQIFESKFVGGMPWCKSPRWLVMIGGDHLISCWPGQWRLFWFALSSSVCSLMLLSLSWLWLCALPLLPPVSRIPFSFVASNAKKYVGALKQGASWVADINSLQQRTTRQIGLFFLF